MKKKLNIGIIGFGNMGKAIAQGLKRNYTIYIFDRDRSKTQDVEGLNITRDVAEILSRADTIMLAVKPQDFEAVIGEIKSRARDKLIISIAAGVPTAYLENRLGKIRVVRVMPNLAVKLGKGMSCLCKGAFADSKDLTFVEKMFKYLGTTLILDEEMMDAATAVSGSGPAYFYDFIESEGIDCHNISEQKINDFSSRLKEAAEEIGFKKDEAALLVKATVEGSLALLTTQKMTVSQLKSQIISKGGTTEAALNVLHQGGSFKEAVKAALKRGKELVKR